MPVAPAQCPEGTELAVQAWNLMGGLDWAAVPIVAEILGVTDIDRLVHQLAVLRDAEK